MYAIGSRLSRRAIIVWKLSSVAGDSSSEPVTAASRVTPAAAAIRSCASSRADSMPQAASLRAALSISSNARRARTSLMTMLRAERLLLIVGRQRVDHRIDFAVEKIVELMNRHVNAMVGHARLRKIVRADALGADRKSVV